MKKSTDHSVHYGMITKEEVIQALLQSNINLKIDYNLAKNIVDDYNKTDNVEYMKFIAQLIKDSKLAIIKKNTNTQNNNEMSNKFPNNKKSIFTGKKNKIKKNIFTNFRRRKKA